MKDLVITKIVQAFYQKIYTWERDFFAPRINDGIVLFTEGMIEYDFGDKKLLAQKGDILFLPGNIPYSGKRLSDTVAYYVLDFNCLYENDLNELVGPSIYSGLEYGVISKKFSDAVKAWDMQYLDVNFELKEFAYFVLSCVSRSKSKTKEGTAHTEMILDYISKNVRRSELSLAELCSEFFISPSQLRRNIFKYTGMNPNQYILKLRLNLAQTELVNTTKSIKLIAQECGFASQYYFSRCFTYEYGLSPKTFRMHYRNT